jgi:antitoxin component of MazEF toxin-antitoxin module
MDYKKYSLENLENWLQDAISCSEATPQEIYDVIKGVVSENYYIYKDHTERCYELLALLNGNGKDHLSCDKDDTSPECKGAWNDFWEQVDGEVKENIQQEGYAWTPVPQKDKVVKWQLPVEVDGPSGEYFVCFPDDLLEAANLKEGDNVEWIDRGDGSFELRKVNGTK